MPSEGDATSVLPAPSLEYGPEWAVLEFLAVGVHTPERLELLVDLTGTADFDWGELVWQASRHRMIPMLAYHCTEGRGAHHVPPDMRTLLRNNLQINRERTGLMRSYAFQIVEGLHARGIRFAGTKGVVFDSLLYEGSGARYIGDLDFMVDSANSEVVEEVLSGLGYEIGMYNWALDKIEPTPRKEMIFYRLNPDHLPIYVIRTPEQFVRTIRADFAFSFTWTKSDYEVPLEDALRELQPHPIIGHGERVLPAMVPAYQFIFTVFHLFREAWFDRYVEIDKDVNLAKFMDVIRLSQRYPDLGPELLSVCQRFDVLEPVLWVLEHADRAFGTSLTGFLGSGLSVSEEWLATARTPNGSLRPWKGTMRERLHTKNRGSIFG